MKYVHFKSGAFVIFSDIVSHIDMAGCIEGSEVDAAGNACVRNIRGTDFFMFYGDSYTLGIDSKAVDDEKMSTDGSFDCYKVICSPSGYCFVLDKYSLVGTNIKKIGRVPKFKYKQFETFYGEEKIEITNFPNDDAIMLFNWGEGV